MVESDHDFCHDFARVDSHSVERQRELLTILVIGGSSKVRLRKLHFNGCH